MTLARVDDIFIGLEAMAVQYASEATGVEFVRRGMKPAVKRFARLHTPDDLPEIESVDNFIYRPDGFAIVRDEKICHFWILEIEDTCTLSSEKLKAYVDLWWAFDSTLNWQLHLWLTDRYGRGSELDLFAVWFAFERARILRLRVPSGAAA